MKIASDVVLHFSKVTPSEAREAFAFHQSSVEGDAHVWPRSMEEVGQWADDGLLFGVRRSDTAAFVGLCYVRLNEEDDVWELGGLTVPGEYRGQGIGRFLVRVALTHTIAFERPFQANQPVIAHVHESNDKPRKLLQQVGFTKVRSVTVPRELAPASMRRNAMGDVVGDEFNFVPTHVVELVKWLDNFDGVIIESGVRAEIRLGKFLLEDLRIALRETAADVVGGAVPTPRSPTVKS